MTLMTVLTIAGSDSSGGAGIQADLKTFTALGCYGATVITALTAQSTTGVVGVHATPPEFVEQQLRAVLDDFSIKAFKTGMLHDAAIIEKVTEVLKTHQNGVSNAHIVVDPVMVSTSGHRLLELSAVNTMRSKLFPLATIVTPNIREAELLLAEGDVTVRISTITHMCNAAKRLVMTYGAKAVLLKGGHLEMNLEEFLLELRTLEDCAVDYANLLDPEYPAVLRSAVKAVLLPSLVVDVLYEPDNKSIRKPFTLFANARLPSSSTHGTGCTLAAAIACGLAKGLTIVESIKQGIVYTHEGISTAVPLGRGAGPLNHLHPVIPRVVPLPSTEAPHPFVSSLIYGNVSTWKQYVQHPFVIQLGNGTLPRECFVHFIEQDYLYLQYYARAHALLALKSTTYEGIQTSAQIMLHVMRESKMHESFCDQWGVSVKGGVPIMESTTTTAYGSFIIDAGLRGDDLTLVVALAACLLGYGEVGLWLRTESEREDSGIHLEGNPYRKWIEDYSGEEYQAACQAGLAALESRIAIEGLTPTTYGRLKATWYRCVELEKAFWDMAFEVKRDE